MQYIQKLEKKDHIYKKIPWFELKQKDKKLNSPLLISNKDILGMPCIVNSNASCKLNLYYEYKLQTICSGIHNLNNITMMMLFGIIKLLYYVFC